MFFQIDPIQLSIVRTCNAIDFEIFECSKDRIYFKLVFLFHSEQIYSCQIDLKPEEIEAFYKDQLDLFEWIFLRFNASLAQPKKLKRKEMEEWLSQEYNKKVKKD